MTETVGQADEKRLMRRFFVIWGCQASSLIGSALVQFALVWWLTIETGSATVLAFAMMMAMLPQIVIGPFAGALVDRWNRRHVMIFADIGIAFATVILIALFALDVVQVWHIYVVLLVRSAGGAFHWPAMSASTTLMVPKKHLARVGGLNQAISGAVSIVAPALGAILIMALPMWGVLSVDVLTAIVAVAPLLVVNIPQPVRSKNSDGQDSIMKVVACAVQHMQPVYQRYKILELRPGNFFIPFILRTSCAKGGASASPRNHQSSEVQLPFPITPS